MKKIVFPFVVLPREFISLLKANLSTTPSAETVFSYIRLNKALYHIIDTAFKEFDDGRGPEKVLMALGWSNFRERVSSLYVYKLIYGDFPLRTNIQLVDDVKNDPLYWLEEMGIEDLSPYIDEDEVIKDIVNSNGYYDILNGYNGDGDTIDWDNETYHIMQTNG